MASSRGKDAIEQTRHAYTVIFTTPRYATPTFLHDFQQSGLDPVFIGNDTLWFRKAKPTGLGWSHVFVVPGEDVEMPEDWWIRQKWRFTVGCDSSFEPENRTQMDKMSKTKKKGTTAKRGASEIDDQPKKKRKTITKTEDTSGSEYEESPKKKSKKGKKKVTYPRASNVEGTVAELKRLTENMTYWPKEPSHRLYILRFLTFSKKFTQQGYELHLNTITFNPSINTFDMQIHLSGRVTSTSLIISVHNLDEDAKEPDPMEYFSLISFPSEDEYGRYRGYMASSERKDTEGQKWILGETKGFDEGLVITKRLQLPPKEQAIDKRGWEFGNPHEPYGEDWFG